MSNDSSKLEEEVKTEIDTGNLEEEIIKEVMKPSRIIKNLVLYNYDIDDMFD